MWPRTLAFLSASLLLACGAKPPPERSEAAVADAVSESAVPPAPTAEDLRQSRYGPALDSLLAGRGPLELTQAGADSLRAAVIDSTGRFHGLYGVFGPVVYDRFDFDADGDGDLLFATISRTGADGAAYLARPSGYVLAGPLSLSHTFAVCLGAGGAVVRSYVEDPGAGQRRGATYRAVAVSAGQAEEVERVRVEFDSLGRHPSASELEGRVRSPALPCRVYDLHGPAT